MNSEIFRGQVFLADLGERIGSEQSGLRPVIIVQNDVGNRNSPTVVVVPVTSQIKRTDMPTHIGLRTDFGLDEESIALCEHINTIDKQRLLSYIGQVTEADLIGIDHALAISVGLVRKYNRWRAITPATPFKAATAEEKNENELLLCLCPTCASQFYNSPEHIIRRVNPLQTEKEDCTYCNVRRGVDYRIIKKKKRLGDDMV